MDVNLGELLQAYYMPAVLLACLCIGYIIKRIDFIADKYIPLILGVLGVIFGFMSADFSFNSFVGGLLSGLGAVGLHQLFKQLIEKKDEY